MYRITLLFSFDGVVLVTQNHDTLPSELECLKAPLQDYSAVSHWHLKYAKTLFFPAVSVILSKLHHCMLHVIR